MKKKVTKMIKPNLIDSNEVAAIKEQYPNAKIPEEIPFHNRNHYNFLGLTLVKKSGINYEIKIQLFTKDISDWYSMADSQKEVLASRFGQLIIIHDPTLEQEEETTPLVLKNKKVGRITDAKKKKIQKSFDAYVAENMNEKDDSLTISKEFINELSEKNNVSVDEIKEYLEQLATLDEETTPIE